MKKSMTIVLLVALSFGLLGLSANAEEESGFKEQTTCPVMGGKINKNLYVDHDGKRIYVCCMGCIAPVEKNPEKYIKKLEKEGVVLEAVSQEKQEEKQEEKKGHSDHSGYDHE